MAAEEDDIQENLPQENKDIIDLSEDPFGSFSKTSSQKLIK
jgi:hypothetical protein